VRSAFGSELLAYSRLLFRQWKALIVGAAFTVGFGVVPALTGSTVAPWLWALAVAISVLPASFLVWRDAQHRVEDLARELDTPLQLDIEATDIQWGPIGEGPLRPWQVIFARFRVTNRSPEHRVSLRFYLQVALLNYPEPVLAKGAEEQALMRMLPGQRLPNTIASPLALAPEETRTGALALFLPGAVELVMDKVELDPKGTHVLVVHDYISGKFLELPLTNRTTGSVMRLPAGAADKLVERLLHSILGAKDSSSPE
jgi:hypothetical protein